MLLHLQIANNWTNVYSLHILKKHKIFPKANLRIYLFNLARKFTIYYIVRREILSFATTLLAILRQIMT